VAALPFDLILRLAAILGHGDPMTFILQMTRVYHPKMWKNQLVHVQAALARGRL
jgi:hypothetical protein